MTVDLQIVPDGQTITVTYWTPDGEVNIDANVGSGVWNLLDMASSYAFDPLEDEDEDDVDDYTYDALAEIQDALDELRGTIEQVLVELN